MYVNMYAYQYIFPHKYSPRLKKLLWVYTFCLYIENENHVQVMVKNCSNASKSKTPNEQRKTA